MRVLQFAFDGDPENPFLPENFPTHVVAYTATHDNNTSRGWYESLPESERQNLLDVSQPHDRRRAAPVSWEFHSAGVGVACRPGDCPLAGRARSRRRGPHELARACVGQLGLASDERADFHIVTRAAGRIDPNDGPVDHVVVRRKPESPTQSVPFSARRAALRPRSRPGRCSRAGMNGDSASKTSLIEPMQAPFRCGSKAARKPRAVLRSSGCTRSQASTNGPISHGQTVPW